MRTILLACALVAATATAATAENAFATFVADLVARPDAAKTYLSSCKTLVTPAGEVRRPCTLALADLVGAQGGVTLAVKANKTRDFPRSQLLWREATVEARAGKKVVASFRVIEVVSIGGPDDPTIGVVASHWARLVPDKEAAAAAKAGTLRAPPAARSEVVKTGKESKDNDYDQDEIDRMQAVDTVQQQLGASASVTDVKGAIAAHADDGAIVFGSAPKQRYTGTKGGAAIRTWKLALEPAHAVYVDGDAWVLWGVTTMTAKPSAPGGTAIGYVVFAVFVSRLTPGGGSFVTDPAIVSFAVPQ